MSRFAALDMATLPPHSAIIALDHDAILAARLAELEAGLGEVFSPTKVAEIMALANNLATSPMRYLNEAAAARELYMGNRINEAVRAVFLTMAQGGDLDQIGANRGVLRRVVDDSHTNAVIFEDDDTFRARIQLVMESYSPHGTEGSYVYWALDADERVVDVVVYGPNHSLVPPIPPAQPKMVILSRDGDGSADAGLVETVRAHCTTDKRRPVADLLSVQSVSPVAYQLDAVLHVTTPGSGQAVLDAAHEAAQAFITTRLRIGRKVYRTSLAAALSVKGVVDVELLQPAADIEIGPFEAPHCDMINLSIHSVTGGWRDV